MTNHSNAQISEISWTKLFQSKLQLYLFSNELDLLIIQKDMNLLVTETSGVFCKENKILLPPPKHLFLE